MEQKTNVWDVLRTFMVLAVVIVILAMLFVAMLFVLKPLASQWIEMSMKVASTVSTIETEPAKAEPTVEPTKVDPTEPTKAPEPTEPAAEPTKAPKATEPGELEHFSCSWLNNCTTKVVPDKTFAITFKKVGALDVANCDWGMLKAEDKIDYTLIDEFLVYSEDSIPEGVSLEQFVAEASKTVWACQAHSTTEIENRKTYYPEFSCSDMSKCKVTTVPEGTFTVGYIPTVTIHYMDPVTREMRDCTTIVWQEGETIEYGKVSEFHTYDRDLPMTNLELFIQSQKPFVSSCH